MNCIICDQDVNLSEGYHGVWSSQGDHVMSVHLSSKKNCIDPFLDLIRKSKTPAPAPAPNDDVSRLKKVNAALLVAIESML